MLGPSTEIFVYYILEVQNFYMILQIFLKNLFIQT